VPHHHLMLRLTTYEVLMIIFTMKGLWNLILFFGWVFKKPLRTSYDEMGILKRVSIIDIFFVISMKTPDMIDRELNQHFLPLKLQAMDRLRVIRSKTIRPTNISSTCRPNVSQTNDMVRDVLSWGKCYETFLSVIYGFPY
jgi:hypothetical protein